MSSTRVLLLGAAIVAASSLQAGAADLYGGSIKDAPVYAPMAPSPSIYFRVDGGYSSYDTPNITEDHVYDLYDNKIDSTWSVGGGVGTYFGRGFRGDITVDHRFDADTEGTLLDYKSDLRGTRKFGLKSTVALANVYYDFDFGSRFTPYLGLGLGFSHNKTTAGVVLDDCGCTNGLIEGDSNTSVAGAAMAGFSVKLRGGQTMTGGYSIKDAPVAVDTGRGLYLDVGYRFLYLGDAQTGAVTAIDTAGDHVVSEDPTVDEIHAHEFRFGLRYDLR